MTDTPGYASGHIGTAAIIKSSSSIVLESPISCLAFAPKNKNVVIVGTYQLQEGQSGKDETNTQQNRNGDLEIFELIGQSL